MSKVALRVPPKFAKTYDIWEREDGTEFMLDDKGWWVKIKVKQWMLFIKWEILL